MADADPLISVGRIGRAHGLDGSFHVTQPRERVLGGAQALIVGGAEIAIVRHDGTPSRPILKLAGVSSREAVDRLRGTDLWMRRSDAPPLEEDEWYAEDLEGLAVRDGETEVGVVRAMLALPSCEVLEVAREGRGDLLVPLVSDAVRRIDVEAGVVDVDLRFLGEE
jgi:16S rRNA processing protein RimM